MGEVGRREECGVGDTYEKQLQNIYKFIMHVILSSDRRKCHGPKLFQATIFTKDKGGGGQ